MEKYKLAKTFMVFKAKEFVVLNKGTNQKIISNNQWEKNKAIFKYLLRTGSFSKSELKKAMYNLSIDEDMQDYILNGSIIIDDCFDEAELLSRSELMLNYHVGTGDYKDLLSKIGSFNFFIVGCGGIGNAISYALASIGAKNFVLFDKDIVEDTNLNRQFIFLKKDAGKLKTKVLKSGLIDRFDNLSIETNEDYAGSDSLFLIEKIRSMNFSNTILILSADEKAIIEEINELTIKFKIPMLNIGYFNDISTIGPFFIPWIENSACIFCNKNNVISTSNSTLEDSINSYCNKAPSWYLNNALAVSLSIPDIIKFIEGNYSAIKSTNKRVGINNWDLSLQEVAFPRNLAHDHS